MHVVSMTVIAMRYQIYLSIQITWIYEGTMDFNTYINSKQMGRGIWTFGISVENTRKCQLIYMAIGHLVHGITYNKNDSMS